LWVDDRQPLDACHHAELLIGANEIIDWRDLMEMKGDGQLDSVQGTEPPTHPVIVEEFASGIEVSVEHPDRMKETAIDVDPEATLELTIILGRDHTHPNFLGKTREDFDRREARDKVLGIGLAQDALDSRGTNLVVVVLDQRAGIHKIITSPPKYDLVDPPATRP
jgi:hypothetical protein